MYNGTRFSPTKENRRLLEKLILDDYDPSLSLTELRKKILLHSFVGTDAVRHTLRRHGLKPREGRGSAPRLQSNPFLIGDPDNEYWLGMMQTDGGITDTTMTLYSTDLESLRLFHVHCDMKLGEYFPRYSTKQVLRINFGHKPTLEYLIGLGYVKNKMGGFQFKYELTSSMVRGIFDADGYFRRRNNGGTECKITTGNPYLVSALDKFCDSISVKHSYITKGNSGDFYILGGIPGICTFLNHIYSVGKYFNRRRFDSVKHLLSEQVVAAQEANWDSNKHLLSYLIHPETAPA